jgi:hypothetical protein
VIVDFLVTAFLGLLNALLGLFPVYELWEQNFLPRNTEGNLGLNEWTVRIAEMLALWDLYFPVSALFVCLGVIVAARLFVVVVELIQWAWRNFPLKST